MNKGRTILSTLPLARDVVQYAEILNKLVDYLEVKEVEETKRLAIQREYELRAHALAGEIQKMEDVILSDNKRKEAFIDGTMVAIIKLIDNNEHELAELFHKRILNMFDGNPLQTLIDYRNEYASSGFINIKIK